MKKRTKRILSWLLAFTLLLQMAPFEALAADDVSPPVGVIPADENGNAVEPVDEDPIYATDENGDPIYDEESGRAEDAYIVGEAYDARDEFQKDYRLSDGSFIAVEYGVPVHYEEDGEWQDIDNRLEPIAMYDVSQSFSASLADGSIMASSSGDSMLSVSLWDGASSEKKPVAVDLDTEPDTQQDEAESDEPDSTQVSDSAPEAADTEDQAEVTAEPKQVENADSTVADETVLPEDESIDEETSDPEAEPAPEATPEEQEPAAEAEPEEETEEQDQLLPFNRDATAKIAEDDLVSAVAMCQNTSEEPRKKTDVIPAALQSTVLYENVYEDVDLQYDLFSYNIKESIILKAPQEQAANDDAASTPYRYCFRLDLANLTPSLQEDGSILMTDNQDQPVYEIPAPFMIDANGEVSDAVAYSLTQLEDSYLLTVEADAQWLEAEERAYPVTIDPTIMSKRSETVFTGGTAAEYWSSSAISSTQMACGYHQSDSGCYGTMYMYFNIANLPKIDSGSSVVDATVGLHMIDYRPKYDSSAKSVLSIHEVTTSLSGTSWIKNLNWNNKPQYDYAMDYVIASCSDIGSYKTWDVTRAAKNWYANGTTNCNLAVTSDQTDSTKYRAWFDYDSTAVIIVTYRNTTGIESYYTYEEQNILRAGSGYVGDYSSALTIVKEDLSFPSTSMPFTLSHVYNSDLHSGNISDSWLLGVTAADYINMRTGFGWQLSAQESVGKTTIGDTTYLVYRDGDGTMHFFTYDSSSGKYKDEDGLNLSIAASSSGSVTTYTMTDDDGNTRFFYNSYLTYIKDANGNRICFVYNGKSFSATGTGWYPSTNGSYLSAIYAVSSGNTSSSKICTLTYDQNHYLASITDYADRTTTFEYSNLTENSAYLTKVNHPDKTTATYGYSSGWLNSAYDDESKYGVEYGYSGTEISSIEEYTGSARGSKILRQKNGVQETKYRYVGDDREANTDDDIVTKYTFDYAGRTINAVTLDNSEREVLGVTAAAYTTNTSRSGKNNRIEKDAQSGQNGINLLVAGGLETHDSFSTAASYWTRVTYPDEGSYSKKNAVVKTGEKAHHGTSAIKSYLSSASTADSSGTRYAGMYQTVTLSPGTYTFSAYVNTTGLLSCDATGGIYAAFADKNGKFLARGIKVNYATNANVDDGWERVHVTYTVPTAGTYRCMVLAENAYGPVYYDDLQLERGSAASTANLLQNGWFRSVTDPQEWTTTNLHLYNETGNESNYVGYLWGNPYGMKRSSQTIPINKPATDTYLISGWGAAYAAADNETALTDSTAENNSKRYFGLIARCNYSDGTKEYFYMPFNDDYPLWQYASCVIAPKKENQSKTLSTITVILAYDGNLDGSTAMGAAFDNISLRQEPCSTYTYDSKGNLTAVNAAGSGSDFSYSAGNKLTESKTKANGTYTYKYENSNNNHLVTKITNDNVSMNITYDNYGNSTGTTLSSDSNSSAGKIVTSAKYSDDGTQMTSQTDASGSTTTYTYNTQRTVSSQEDAKGTTNYHSYFAESGRPKTNYIDKVISAGYEYSCGNLVTVRRSGFITSGGTKLTQYYNMGYDGFGNMTSISVGSRELASYDYGSQNGNLRSMTYGNGATVSYTYDSLDRVTEEKWGDTLKYQYFYNAEGDLAKKLDVTTGKAVNYEYDSLGRLIHSYQTDNGTIQQHTEHLYDTENRLVSQSWQLGNTMYKEAFTYDSDDGSLTKVDGTGFTSYAFSYDALKRLSSRYNWIYRQNYTYRTNGSNQTTQIASIDYVKRDGGTSFSDFKLSYTYAQGGNIATITGTTRTDQNATYSYDKQGQLTKEVNTSGTYNYTYDTYGNIRSVSGAASHTYTYGDSEWLDLLTAYDGKAITYDTIGNPNVWHNGTGDWNLSWANGRQLTTASNDNHRVSYTYDLAGVRDSKTVDGVTYNYITQNGQVVRQTWGSHVMDFIYDNTGKPYAVKYDGTLYYYVLNLQGDVISIITHWGESYGSYTYDAWGNVLSVSGDIAKLNPIRYRGYYYDSETELYYLGSRYYDPQVKRFINADGAAFATINPYSNGLTDKNYFAYCDNDPVDRADDGGELWGEILTGIAVVAGLTAVAAVAVATAGVGAVAVAGSGAILTGTIGSGTTVLSAVAASSAIVSLTTSVAAKKVSKIEGFRYGQSSKASFSEGANRYKSKNGRDKVTPGNNRAQNQQFRDATRGLTKREKRRLHDEQRNKSSGYHDLKRRAEEIKKGRNRK